MHTKACAGDYTKACEKLGEIYQLGKGVDIDLETAIGFYQKDCRLKKAGGCAQLKSLGVKYSHEARPISRYPPLYPPRAFSKGLQGKCKLTYDVSAKGRVQNVKVDCTNRIFNRAALASIRKWKYEPQIIDGVAVMSKGLTTSITFNLAE